MTKKQFPRNYRVIPEIIKNISDELFILAGLVCLLAAILLVQADLYTNLKSKNKLDSEKVKVYQEINFWQNQSQIRPDYRDAYLYLTILNYQLGNLNEAKMNLSKALDIDPNFERKKEFEAILK